MQLPLGPRGTGIGLRQPHVAALLETTRRVDWVEIIPENYIGRGGRWAAHLDAVRVRWPVLVHGVSLSLGGPDPFDAAYFQALAGLLRQVDAPFYTDHICYAQVGGMQSHQLLPLPFTLEAVHHVAGRIRLAQRLLDIPIAVENISFYATMPGSDMHWVDFVAAVVEEADCGLMFDVNNLYVNTCNHGGDPVALLDRLPLDRVVQIHMAGHERRGGRVLDHHGSPVDEAVLSLYEAVIARIGEVPTLLEWDLNLPDLDTVLDEADRIRHRARISVGGVASNGLPPLSGPRPRRAHAEIRR